MIVYGDPSWVQELSGAAAHLRERLCKARSALKLGDVREALIFAGQLEQATADMEGACPGAVAPEAVEAAVAVTDLLADALCRWSAPGRDSRIAAKADLQRAVAALDAAAFPAERARFKVPEGFAFYALFPEQYMASAALFARASPPTGRVLVVGIRSIGTTLSAVVAATLRSLGWDVRRTTVRPTGSPVAREAVLAASLLEGISHALVVDEGPGLSGSSMHAVAVALRRAGVRDSEVSFLPGHGQGPGPSALPEVLETWRRIPSHVVPLEELRWNGRTLFESLALVSSRLGAVAPLKVDDLSGGQWRRFAYESEQHWPAACWPFERPKYLCSSGDRDNGGRFLWTFSGLVPSPRWPTERPSESSPGPAHSASPLALATTLGFTATRWVQSPPLTRNDATADLARFIGKHIAQVAMTPLSSAEAAESFDRLRTMLVQNTREALGDSGARFAEQAAEAARRFAPSALLPSAGDRKLAPYHWRHNISGALVKVGIPSFHDHTVVGAQPFTWDLAGALVEWRFSPQHSRALFAGAQSEGLPPPAPPLLRFHTLAYVAFRLGQCSLTADLTADAAERARLHAAVSDYTEQLRSDLADSAPLIPSGSPPWSSRTEPTARTRRSPPPTPTTERSRSAGTDPAARPGGTPPPP
jgi:hypothetical protein